MAISEDRAAIIENKIDKLSEAVTRLVLIDERQITQGGRLGKLEEEHAKLQARYQLLDAKVERWINMGIGAWAVMTLVFVLWQAIPAFKGN